MDKIRGKSRYKTPAIVSIAIILVVLLVIFFPEFFQFPRAAIDNNSEYKDVVITMERGSCFGFCAVYKLTVYGNGKVVYKGIEYVKSPGVHTETISQDKIKQLVDGFNGIDYLSLKDKYSGIEDKFGNIETITDGQTTVTSLTSGGKTKTVEEYYGAPDELVYLEDKIDELTNSRQWIGH